MDDSLAHIAATFLASLPADTLVSVFPIDPLDRLGVPVAQAATISRDDESTIGYGFGATRAQAELGAIGELCEEIHVGAHVAHAPVTLASYAELGDAAVDPLTLCLPAGSPYTPDMELPWIEAQSWPSGRKVLVPREWVAAFVTQLPDTPRLITPITNGLGAGLDIEHAIAHGVLEALQRDGNVLNYRALDRGVIVDLDRDVPPDVTALVARLQDSGIALTVKLAATDFGIANLYVVGDDLGTPTVPIQITACGEAPHPDRDVALRKAVLEFCGSRARKAATHGPIEAIRRVFPSTYFERQMASAYAEAADEEPRAVTAMAEWIGADAATLRQRLAGTVFSDLHHVSFGDLPTVPAAQVASSKARLDLLTSRLAAEGLEILWIDCSPLDSPVKVVKVVVPGLECETMSYHRIGWRGVRRLRDRADPLLLDAPRPGAKLVLLRPEDEERAGGRAWFDVDLADRIVGDLYPLYREPGPFSAQLLRQQESADA